MRSSVGRLSQYYCLVALQRPRIFIHTVEGVSQSHLNTNSSRTEFESLAETPCCIFVLLRLVVSMSQILEHESIFRFQRQCFPIHFRGLPVLAGNHKR